MKKIVSAGIGLLALAVAMPAAAADLPKKAPVFKAPPPIVDPWTWTGIYVGLNVGYSWGKSETHVDYFNPVTGLPIVPPPGSVTDVDFKLNGWVGGGQIGANLELDKSWLVGVEADIQWTGQKGDALFTCAAVPIFVGPCFPGLTFLLPGTGPQSLALSQKLEWFGTLRGRLGVLFTPTMVGYVTGGLAYGEIQTDGILSGIGLLLVPTSVAFSHSQTKAGWTIGGGIEGRLWDNWTGKIEYLYMDLGTVSGTVVNLPILIGATYSSRITDNILRVGVNYKFRP